MASTWNWDNGPYGPAWFLLIAPMRTVRSEPMAAMEYHRPPTVEDTRDKKREIDDIAAALLLIANK